MPAQILKESQVKTFSLKREIVRICIKKDKASIADFSKSLNTSIPTITKLVQEMVSDGFLQAYGKVGTKGGRRPCVFGLNPLAGYFIGVDIGRQHFHLAVTDFTGELIHYMQDIEFVLEDNHESFSTLCRMIKEQVSKAGVPWPKIMGAGISLSGRVNPEKGYSLSYFVKSEIPLTELFQQELNIPVNIENDSRAMTYGEYMNLGKHADPNMLFFNISWGLGMGIVQNGSLYFGKSGFSGEIGHFPILDNNRMCRCGKIGCLETEVSGQALHRMIIDGIKNGKRSSLQKVYKENGDITLPQILNAIEQEDVLTIESLEHMGNVLGRSIAGLINIFNPGLVIIGGQLITGGDYMMLPIKSAINKYSMARVISDTRVTMSTLGRKAAAIGDCLLSRGKVMGIM
ncbi:MAG: ROK family protein [Bacteroidales bacterium]|nr:ROK family protein [Bacteroidales bacterium]